MFTFISLSAVQNMVDFIYFSTCHFHYDRVYYELTMACSPVGLIRSVDRALRLVIAKVRVRFLIKPGFFRVFFFNRLGCSFYCEDHDHFHNIIFVVFVRNFDPRNAVQVRI